MIFHHGIYAGLGGGAMPAITSYQWQPNVYWEYPDIVLADNTDFTMEFLYELKAYALNTASTLHYLVSRGSDAAGGWSVAFRVFPNGGLGFSIIKAGGQYSIEINLAVFRVELDTIYHIAGSVDYTTGTMRLYVNGELLDTAAGPASASLRSSSYGIAVNAVYPTDASYYISNLRVWNTVRTAAQITDNMYALLPSTSGLLMQVPFNEGTGIYAKNNLNNVNGTISGTGAGTHWGELGA